MAASIRTVLVVSLLAAACGPTASDPYGGEGGYSGPGGWTGPDGGSGGAGGAGEVRERLAFAAYNVHRFFDTVCDSGECAAGDYEEQPTQAEFEAKADTLAAAVRRLASDVLCLEEVENQTALDALAARVPEFPSKVMGETGYPASVDVALLAKDPVTLVRRHRSQVLTRPDGTTTSFAREFLEVHLDVDGTEAIVFCAHFKAKSDDDPGRRLAEAQAAAQILHDSAVASPNALILMGGDLNDTPGSPPIDALEASGDLLRVASDMTESQATYTYHGTGSALDHLFVDVRAGGGYVPGSTAIFRDGAGLGLGGSDHAAIRALFRPGAR
jgi:endonuclease/exonuclease/phosphatase family metal-dependent hydrolase